MSGKSFLSTDIFAQLFRKKDAAQFHFNGAETNCPQCTMEYVYVMSEELGQKRYMCQNCGHAFYHPQPVYPQPEQVAA